MKAFLVRLLLYLMPRRTYSAVLGWFSKTHLSARLVPWYARHFQIDISELAQPMDSHRSLGAFFIRQLMAESRPIGEGVVSPVDGTVAEMGRIDENILVQVKGFEYSVNELVVDPTYADMLQNGSYLTLYLSPSDYHRIHAPVESIARSFAHIPGTLYPVNAWGLNHVKRLFVRNERVITWFESTVGQYAMVKVGAAGVGSVVVRHQQKDRASRRTASKYPCDLHYAKGDEIGYFALGSTVILLFPAAFKLRWTIRRGDKVKMGRTIAYMQGNH